MLGRAARRRSHMVLRVGMRTWLASGGNRWDPEAHAHADTVQREGDAAHGGALLAPITLSGQCGQARGCGV